MAIACAAGRGRTVRVIRVELSVDCDDHVTPEMVRDIVKNHMWWCPFNETSGGGVDWRKTRVTTVYPASQAA